MRSLPKRLAGFVLLLGLFVVPAAVGAAPALSVAHGSGPAGTQFTITGTGLPAGPALYAIADASNNLAGGDQTTVAADGTMRATVNSTGFKAGTYIVVIGTTDGKTAYATANFTVTAGGAGGTVPSNPPATGGGGMANRHEQPVALMVALAAVALAALGFGGVLRRHRAA